MVSPLFYSELALLAFIWLFVLLLRTLPRRSAPPPAASATPLKSKRKRSTEPTLFASLTQKPPRARWDLKERGGSSGMMGLLSARLTTGQHWQRRGCTS
jgi:hypothetical protein